MFSSEIGCLIHKEKINDLQREAERHQLVKAARLGRPGHREELRRMAGWIHSQLVTRSSILHHHDRGPHQTVSQRG